MNTCLNSLKGQFNITKCYGALHLNCNSEFSFYKYLGALHPLEDIQMQLLKNIGITTAIHNSLLLLAFLEIQCCLQFTNQF